MYKIRKDLSISDKDKKILTTEIISKESKNMLLSCCYRPPKGITENLTAYLTSIFQRVQNQKKKSFIIGNFNLFNPKKTGGQFDLIFLTQSV